MRQAVPDGPTQRGCQSAFAGAIRDEAAPRQGAPSPVRSADAARQAAAPLTYPPAHAAHRSAYGTAPGATVGQIFSLLPFFLHSLLLPRHKPHSCRQLSLPSLLVTPPAPPSP